MIQVWRSPSTRLLRGLENALDALRGAVEDDVDLARLLDVAQQPLHLLLGVRALLRQLPHRDLHVGLRRRLQQLLQPHLCRERGVKADLSLPEHTIGAKC